MGDEKVSEVALPLSEGDPKDEEYLKFETAWSFVTGYLDSFIPRLRVIMESGDAQTVMEICNQFAKDISEKVRDLSCVYYEIILRFISLQLVSAGIPRLRTRLFVERVGGEVDKYRAAKKVVS